MILKILTPQSAGAGIKVSKVFLPGADGRFEVLENHAPLLSALAAGTVAWCDEDDGSQGNLDINSGFARVEDNVITVVVG